MADILSISNKNGLMTLLDYNFRLLLSFPDIHVGEIVVFEP
jgi:hypothetical protein